MSQPFNSLDLISRLQQWYARECNGDWEHSYGISIETLDNPGWMLSIDLSETIWEGLSVERRVIERSASDWVQVEVSKRKFVGSGGPENLGELISLFFQTIDES